MKNPGTSGYQLNYIVGHYAFKIQSIDLGKIVIIRVDIYMNQFK